MAGSVEQSSRDRIDRDLMAYIAEGQESALSQLYQRHSASIFAICLRMLEDRQDAEDVLLEVFWEVWSRPHRYDAQRSAPRTYLTLLARSRAIDRGRQCAAEREKRQATAADVHHRIATHSQNNTPSHRLESQEKRSLVADAMNELNEADRRALELAFFANMTHRQIAEELNSPLGTIKTRIRKSLNKLRLKLGQIDQLHQSP